MRDSNPSTLKIIGLEKVTGSIRKHENYKDFYKGKLFGHFS